MLRTSSSRKKPYSLSNVLAGQSGTAGFGDGEGILALFNTPQYMVYDGNHNLYVSDLSNHSIRKVTPAGIVTTYAGSGTPGPYNGPGASASFNYPAGLSIDSNSNIYVADTGNNAIRKIDTSQNVTSLSLSITGPTEVAVDSSGSNLIATNGSGFIWAYLSGSNRGQIYPSNAYGYSNVSSVACRPDGVFYYTPSNQSGQAGLVRLTFGNTAAALRYVYSSSSGTRVSGYTPITMVTSVALTSWDPWLVGSSVTLASFSGDSSVYNGTFTILSYQRDTPGAGQNTITFSLYGVGAGNQTYSSYPTATVYGQDPTHSTVVIQGNPTSSDYYTRLSFQSTSKYCVLRNLTDFKQYDLSGDTADSNSSNSVDITGMGTSNPYFAVKSITPFEFTYNNNSGTEISIYNKKY
jgi:hypothetical protein